MQLPSIFVRRIAWSAILPLCLVAPHVAEAAAHFFGGADVAAGRAENPGLVDPNAPASERRGQMEGTLRLLAGLRARWDQTDLEISYSPYGEYHEEAAESRIVHFLESAWTHDYTPRLSLRLTDAFTHVPETALDAGSSRTESPLAGATTSTSNDFGTLLAYEAGPRTTLGFSYADIRRTFSADPFVDSTQQVAGVEIKRRLGRHHSLLAGFEYGLYAFRDGEPLPGAGSMIDPNDIDPNNVDPNNVDPNNSDPNNSDPNNPDPNCILFPWLCLPSSPAHPGSPASSSSPHPAAAPAAASPSAPGDGSGSARRRARAGYAYDHERGFHFDLEGGRDILTPDEAAAEPVTTPYVRSAVGWNGAKIWARVGWTQGFHEGGGLFTNAVAKSSYADARIRLSDRLSLGLLAIAEEQEGLDEGGSLASPGRLEVFRGTGSLDIRLSQAWSLILAFAHYRQSSEDLGEPVPDVRTNRHSLGLSWRFGPIERPPTEPRTEPPEQSLRSAPE